MFGPCIGAPGCACGHFMRDSRSVCFWQPSGTLSGNTTSLPDQSALPPIVPFHRRELLQLPLGRSRAGSFGCPGCTHHLCLRHRYKQSVVRILAHRAPCFLADHQNRFCPPLRRPNDQFGGYAAVIVSLWFPQLPVSGEQGLST